MIEWPPKLVEQIARRRAIPYIGAGISRASTTIAGARPPLWEEFLKDACSKLPNDQALAKRLIRDKRFLDACSLLIEKLGPEWIDLVQDKFGAAYRKSDNHEHIYDLDCPIVITPNFDKIYETFATTQSEGTVTVKSYYSDDLLRHVRGGLSARLILKCHGSIDTPDRLVFSREKYSNLIHQYATYNDIMNALFLTWTIVFFGTSGSDPDINLILERHVSLHENASPHFFVTSDADTIKMKSILARSYNIHLIPYKSENNHKQLTDGLASLKDLVLKRREEIASTLQW